MDTRTPEQAYQEGFENGRTNGRLDAMMGEEPLPTEALEEALAAATTDNGRAWARGWHEGYNAGHRDACAEGVDHSPKLMAQQAENAVLSRDPQQAPLYAHRMGYEDGFMWDTDEPAPRGYIEPTIQSMPDDDAEGYRLGFIAGYRAVHPFATEAEAQEEYLWRIHGHDEKGNPVTLEERNRRIAEDEAR